MELNRLLFWLVLCGVCAGCISDPYIGESLAKLDRLPKTVKLPVGNDVADVAAGPVEKDKLLGEWDSGAVEELWRHVDGDGVYDTKKSIKAMRYSFFSDGSFCRAEAVKMFTLNQYGMTIGVGGYLLKSIGNWKYENGILTLNTKLYDLQVTDGWSEKVVSKKKEECNLIKELNVTCYKGGGIAFEAEDLNEEGSQADGTRKISAVDNCGIRTERTIKVTGVRNGREVGVVEEKISPPIRFMRKSE